jgi:cytochrome c-type biogenesis protein CcmH
MQTANFKLKNDGSHSEAKPKNLRSFAALRMTYGIGLHFSWFDKLTMTLSPSNGSFCSALAVLALLSSLWLASPSLGAESVDFEERVRAIAAELRCVVCQNLSVADSPSELAQQMREVVRQQLREGKSPEEIKAFFVSKYGDWVLLAPPREGFSLLVWILPFVAAAAGLLLVFFALRRWATQKKTSPAEAVDPDLLARVRREASSGASLPVDLEADDPRGQLRKEQARLYGEIEELDFDHQAGRLSDADYAELRREVESKAAAVLKDLDAAPEETEPSPPQPQPRRPASKRSGEKKSVRGWRIAAGGAFLLIFGITVGVFLTQSLRPRTSEQDLITGGFMTGTAQGKDIGSLLARGRSSYEQGDWPPAIEAFKGALAIDPNHPEAHSYMGLILVRAGHPEGALMAFDRALSADPKFPLALWGKGMLLYRANEDLAGAQETLRKLLTVMAPGEESKEIEATLAEIAELRGKKKPPAQKTEAALPIAPQPQRIQGVISIDPGLQIKVDGQTSLFIIARRSSGSAGAPLAVKKIDRPVFPFTYSLGPEDAMMQGTPYPGELFISARLDKDGNAMTREEEDLAGEFKGNPAKAGSQKVDIVLSRAK